MNIRNLKLGITIMIVALFISCKSSEPDSNSNDLQRGQGNQGRQGGQPNVEQLLTQMDTNGDGKLSKDEVKGPLKNDFSKIDTDEDGYLSKTELENAPKPERQGRPQRN